MFRKSLLCIFVFSLLVAGCKQNQEQNKAKNTDTERSGNLNKTNTTNEGTGSENQNKTVVAMVNDVPIYKEDLRGFDVQKAIQHELLYQYGLKHGYLDDSIKERVKNFQESLVISKVKIEAIRNYMASNPVTQEEIDQEYKNNADKFTYLNLSELDIKDKDTADSIYKKVKSGADFSKIASSYGDKVNFRDINRPTNRLNQYFPDFKPGTVSEIVNFGGEYRIYKIEKASELPMINIKRRLQLEKESEKKRTAIDDLVAKIKQSGDFKVQIMNQE